MPLADLSEIKPALKSAISWSIVSEIFRRHGDKQVLRVIQTRPGGGQYDCLSLMRLRDGALGAYAPGNAEHLGDFNRQSGNFHTFPLSSHRPYPWLAEWLAAADPKAVVDHACNLLGFHDKGALLPTSRQTFSVRLIAAILAGRVFDRHGLDAVMVCEDTSGYGGGVLREGLSFPALLREVPPDETGKSHAAECWLFMRTDSRQLVGAIRDGCVSSLHEPDVSHDLFLDYRKQREIGSVLFKALTLLNARQ